MATEILNFCEAHQRSLTEMEELQKFQSTAFDTLARRKLIEDQNTIMEIIRECTRTTKWSKLYERFEGTSRTLNQFAVEIPTLPVNQCLSQHIRYVKGC